MIVYGNAKQGARRGRASGRVVCPAFGSGDSDAKNQADCQVNTTYALRVLANYVPFWLSFALALCFIFLPRIAYAQPEIEVAGNFAGYENGETYKGWVVVDSPNAYTSSIVLIGEYSSLIQIDSTMYAKLSDPVKGGNFYKLTQKWKHIGTNKSGTSSNYPNWAGSEFFIDGLNVVYGYDRNWECVVTTDEVADALRDFRTILEGGDVGGGDDDDEPDQGETDGSYIYFDWTGQVSNALSGELDGVCFNSSDYLTMLSTWSQAHKDYGLYVGFGKSYTYIYAFTYLGASTKPTIEDGKLNWTDLTYKSSKTANNYNNVKSYNNKKYFLVELNSNVWNHQLEEESGQHSIYKSEYAAYYWSKGGGDDGGNDEPITPVDPPDDPLPTQPDPTAPEPDTPTVPRFPEPVDPDVEPDPQPVVPDPEPTVTPPDPTNRIVYEPSNTTPNDYTPWLRAILLQLQQLLEFFSDFAGWLGDEMASHCLHIREHMSDCLYDLEGFIGELLYEYTDDLLKTIAEYAYWLGNNNRGLLEQHHTYLSALAQWIVDNLRWEGSGGEYDDSNVLYWLKRIWAKQGSGTVNTKPTDPVTNYNFYVTWIGSLFDDIGIDLTGTDLDPLIQSIEGLADVFPFSIPWNIIAVFGLLTATPVTPAFDFTIPDTEFFDGYSYEIDMAWLDGAMASVRAIELLAFCCYVLVHTKEFCGFLLGDDA